MNEDRRDSRDTSELAAAGLLSDDPLDGTIPIPTPPAPQKEAEGPDDTLPPPESLDWDAALAELQRRTDGKPLETPWPSVNKAFGGGLWPGSHILVGGTGSGKTQWALQLGHCAMLQGIPLLYVALELDDFGIACRLWALNDEHERRRRAMRCQPDATKRVWWSQFYNARRGNGPIGPEFRAQARAAAERLRELPLRIEHGDARGWPYDALFGATEAVAEEFKTPPLVVLDFLQLVASPPDDRRGETIRERIGGAAYGARAVARELGATVISISSTAREVYKSGNNIGSLFARAKPKQNSSKWPPPWLLTVPDMLVGLGKESGETEYSADSVSVLTPIRPEVLPQEQRGGGRTPMVLAVAKLRAGRTSWAPLVFDGALFEDPAELEPPPIGDRDPSTSREAREEAAEARARTMCERIKTWTAWERKAGKKDKLAVELGDEAENMKNQGKGQAKEGAAAETRVADYEADLDEMLGE